MFASELYDNVTTRVARDPTALRCDWKLSHLLVTKYARAAVTSVGIVRG